MFVSLADVLAHRASVDAEKNVYHYLQNDLTVSKSISAGELQLVAGSLASYINKNIVPGARVLLLFENSPEFMFCFFGAILSHAIPACADPSKRTLAKYLSHYLSDLETDHIFTSVNMVEVISEFLPSNRKIRLHVFEEALEKSEDAIEITARRDSDICFIQYTSGSTGNPKGVAISNSNIIANSEQIKVAFEASNESVGLSWLPHFHDMGLVGGLIQPLFSDFPVYIISHKYFAQRPSDWLRAIDKFRVSISGGPNIAYDFLKKENNISENLDLSCWKVAFIGADFVSADTMRKFSANMEKFNFRPDSLVPCYGMAEATLMVCSHKPGTHINTYPHSHFFNLKEVTDTNYYIREDAISCGKVSNFTDIIIVKNNKICEENEPGEICISGKNVVSGYWKQELNLFYPPSGMCGFSLSYLRTGDMGVLVNNELFIIGRIKDLLVINGVNISPTDIEKDIQETSDLMIEGRAIIYQASTTSLGLVQEVEKKREPLTDWHNLSRAIKLNLFKKHGLILDAVEFVRRGSLSVTTSGKIVRSQRSNIQDSSFIFREVNILKQEEKYE